MSPLAQTFSFPMLLALGFFFGLAFEEFHAQDQQVRPGGVRSFPLLALSGHFSTGSIRRTCCR